MKLTQRSVDVDAVQFIEANYGALGELGYQIQKADVPNGQPARCYVTTVWGVAILGEYDWVVRYASGFAVAVPAGRIEELFSHAAERAESRLEADILVEEQVTVHSIIEDHVEEAPMSDLVSYSVHFAESDAAALGDRARAMKLDWRVDIDPTGSCTLLVNATGAILGNWYIGDRVSVWANGSVLVEEHD
jgi:hypothetical protein